MRSLFEIDTKDYASDGRRYVRPSVRAVIVSDGKILMVHSKRYNYYKFPGGGIEEGESHLDALLRESREEAGVLISPESVVEYGFVHRVESTDIPGYDVFVQDNYYYLAESIREVSQMLDGYEEYEEFTPVLISAEEAIRTNRECDHGPKNQNMIEREARVLGLLISDGYLD
jgi:8-oxo-dGTP pyrophosphatase MutT (NUDIX family)